MKIWKTFFLLSFLTRSFNMTGQGRFLDSTYIWTESRCFGFHGNCSTIRYTFAASPTEINGKQYYEKLSSSSPTGNNWGSTNYFYRTDDLGKVYVSYFGNENLVYDYSLEVNDSFYVNNGFDNIYLVVDKIDSIQLENGEKRKQLAMRCSFDETPEHAWGYSHWIEGLGGLSGVYDIDIQECVADGSVPTTLCIFRNDTLLYDNPDYDSCWYVPTATKNIFNDIISIYPNPASSEIFISSKDHQVQNVFAIDLLGNTTFIENTSPFDISPLPPGYYFLQIELENNHRVMEGLIKE